jgi:2-oxoisovalerate dehydrogenase E1 component
VIAVYRAVTEAATRARKGEGPSLLEFKTFRMRGHEEASGVAYVPPELFEEWKKRDPIASFERFLTARGLLNESERDTIRDGLKSVVDKLVDEALDTKEPASSPEAEIGDVYALAPSPKPPEAGASSVEMRYIDAIQDGLRIALRENPRVVLLGQDIAEYGGAFKATEGLAKEFGKARVRNTPIIESGALGCALGLALDGFRPMVEMQFGDFITCGFNQIVNNLAKTHYRWGASCGVVIRTPVGGGVGAGPFHSQNVESWFTSVAGLKVVAPSNPYDAKGLLLAAFADPNPVLYLEHKFLYRWSKGPVPEASYTLPIGKASIVREGKDATIITYGVGVLWAQEAAAALQEDGKSIEIVDLRTLLPWDQEAALDSVRKTGRVLVLHEAPLTGGFGGEIAATLSKEAFDWLDAPVFRLGALDTPIPFSKALEEVFSPRKKLLPALGELLAY